MFSFLFPYVFMLSLYIPFLYHSACASPSHLVHRFIILYGYRRELLHTHNKCLNAISIQKSTMSSWYRGGRIASQSWLQGRLLRYRAQGRRVGWISCPIVSWCRDWNHTRTLISLASFNCPRVLAMAMILNKGSAQNATSSSIRISWRCRPMVWAQYRKGRPSLSAGPSTKKAAGHSWNRCLFGQ